MWEHLHTLSYLFHLLLSLASTFRVIFATLVLDVHMPLFVL